VLDHFEFERRSEVNGREVMRAIARELLNLRAARERTDPRESEHGSDDVERTEVRPSSRRLGMVFGS
jgi:hypothetical protein